MLETFTCRPLTIRSATLLAAAVVLGACSSGDKTAADTAAASKTAAPASSDATPAGDNAMSGSSSMSGMKMDSAHGMAGMAMTGDPDRDFLRMMSDHHKGLIAMAHMTTESKEGGSAVADAKKLDTKQDAELEKMTMMLEKSYKDPYAPKVMPDNQAMVDDLKGKRGLEYSRTFYQNVVAHHQQALKMVDEYLPKAKSPAVKQMAEKMKADQTAEITEFQKKLAALK